MSESRSVKVVLSAEAAGYIRTMQQAGKIGADAMREVERGTKTASRSLDSLGSTAGKIGAVAAGALFAAGKAAMDWESQFAGVEKTVDGTTSQMAELEGQLREMARTMPATHQEIAATAEAAGQLGVAREDVADFTETMVMLGETTNVTAEDAATSIAQFANVMKMSSGDVDNFAATVVDLGNKGASTEGQILAMAQRVAGAGSLIGASEQDVLALSAAMANLGIQSELGGGAVQRVLVGINSNVASGGEKLERYAEVAGVSAQEFARAWESDPVAAFDTLIQGLGRVQDSGGDVASVLKSMGIEGTQNLQVMLRLAGAGDTLTTALEQSGTAWEKNTALTDEYQKRAETTAAKVQVAWNQIKDAGIEAGAALLPAIAATSEKVGGLATAFGKLPDPVQASVTGLLGITAVTGGGLWFTSKVITGVSETRQALADLAETSPRAAAGLRGVANAATAIAAAAVAAQVIESIERAAVRSAPGVEQLTEKLLNLNDVQVAQELGSEIGDVRSALESLSDPGLVGQLENLYDKVPLGLGSLTKGVPFLGSALIDASVEAENAKVTFEALDGALANIATSGSPEKATATLEKLADMYDLSAEEVAALTNYLPQYKEALAGSANAAELAAGGTEELGGAAGAAAPQVDLMAEALKKSRKEAAETANEFFNLGEGLDDSKVSLGEWLGQLEAQARALRDFRLNAQQAGKKGLEDGLIASLQKAGPEGALRMAQLADATDAEIRRANRAWRAGQREVERYTDAVGGVEPAQLDVDGTAAQQQLTGLKKQLDEYGLTRKNATAALNDLASGRIKTVQGLIDKYGMTRAEARALLQDQASGAIDRVRRSLQLLDGYTVNTYIRTNRIGGVTSSAGGRSVDVPGGADGMTVPGPRYPYGDKMLIHAAPGEEIITNRHGEADAFRADRAAGRIPAYADGGRVRTTGDRWADATRVLTVRGTGAGVNGLMPQINVDAPEVRVYIDDEEIQTRVDVRINDHRAHDAWNRPSYQGVDVD